MGSSRQQRNPEGRLRAVRSNYFFNTMLSCNNKSIKIYIYKIRSQWARVSGKKTACGAHGIQMDENRMDTPAWLVYIFPMVLFDIKARYNPFEAFVFDYFMSQAVIDTLQPFRDAILAEAQPGGRILDIGCGGGQLAIDLKKTRGDLAVTGVDLSINQIRRARARSARASEDVSFIQASALDLPFSDGSFDLVCSVDCLKHWPDMMRGLGECIRLIRPGGMLLITEIDRECTLKRGLQFVRRWRVPGLLKPLSLVPFFLFAVLRSLSMEDARALAGPLPLQDLTIEPGPGSVNWTLKARKPLGLNP
jgi:SAM-dependent methyltransferase